LDDEVIVSVFPDTYAYPLFIPFASIGDDNWNFDFETSAFEKYDISALEQVFTAANFSSVYIQTPYEIFAFRSSGGGRPLPDFDEFFINAIRISHPGFVTKGAIKIGDTIEQFEAVYKLQFDNRSFKQSDEDWHISGDLGDEEAFITFIGDVAGVKYIEVGGRYASV